MLISASRRTDIPACFPKWFLRRIEEGYVLVRNPMNPHQVSRVSLAPQDVDGIMFWTKNPLPMLEAGLSALKNYLYCFQFTVNAYGKEVEPNIPRHLAGDGAGVSQAGTADRPAARAVAL